MTLLLVTLLLPVLIGYPLVRTLTPTLKPAWAGTLLQLSLGAGCGVGLLSLLYFAVWSSIGPSIPAEWAGEILLLIAAAGAGWVIRSRGAVGVDHPVRSWDWLLTLALVAVIAIQAAQFMQVADAMPQGDWDAWAIWNLRAKFLAQQDMTWARAFSPFLGNLPGNLATHPDYPLLLSGYIARCWALTGSMGDVTVPITVSALFWAATVALLVAGLAALRGWTAGALGGMILLSNALFAENAPTQYADAPLGFFFLATLVLLLVAAADGKGPGYSMVLAGFAAGCAAWTKDEGQLFVFVVGCALMLCVLLRRLPARRLMLFAGGLAVPLAATLYFKSALAPAEGSWGALSIASALHQLAEPARYRQILRAFWDTTLSMGLGGSGLVHPATGLGMLLAFLGISKRHLRSPAVLAALGVCGVMLVGYFGVYVVTPFDLSWHLHTSLGRLLTQLVPGITLLLVAVCRTAEETAGVAESRLIPPTAKKRRRA